jgi:Ca2+-binding EF-hand superfamily protein
MLCKTSDGLLRHQDIFHVLQGIGGKPTAQELKDLIHNFVGDKPKVDFDAFIVMMTRRSKGSSLDDEVGPLFEGLDVNKDLFIDAADIVSLMQACGTVVTLGEAQPLLSMFRTGRRAHEVRTEGFHSDQNGRPLVEVTFPFLWASGIRELENVSVEAKVNRHFVGAFDSGRMAEW